ncbi:MAG: hypothetical protein ACLUPD_10555 [Anaerotignum faecicola]
MKLVTSSARKAAAELAKGIRIEVWCENKKVESITCREDTISKYVKLEKEYIARKQKLAEQRNRGCMNGKTKEGNRPRAV